MDNVVDMTVLYLMMLATVLSILLTCLMIIMTINGHYDGEIDKEE